MSEPTGRHQAPRPAQSATLSSLTGTGAAATVALGLLVLV